MSALQAGAKVLAADERKLKSAAAADRAELKAAMETVAELRASAALQLAELTLERSVGEGLRKELAEMKAHSAAVAKFKAAKASMELAVAQQAAEDARQKQAQAEALANRRHSSSDSDISVSDVTYVVSFTTGSHAAAGTDAAGVWVALFGEGGATTGRRKLRDAKLLPADRLANAMLAAGSADGDKGTGRGKGKGKGKGKGEGKGKKGKGMDGDGDGQGGGADAVNALLAGLFEKPGAVETLEIVEMDLGELTGLEVGERC